MDERTLPLILMVDDDQLFGRIVAQKFAAAPFRFAVAQSAQETLQMLGQGDMPALVLLDIHMTGTDGFVLLEKIRAMPATAGLPVIVLSNFNEPKDIERSRQLGALRHIQKVSLTPQEIVDMVSEVLEGRSEPKA
jgi:CheY-like chemotaxis protein